MNSKSIIKTDRAVACMLALFLLIVGVIYSGELYIKHLIDGIAAGAVIDGVHNMFPGDHHEQFYRYSLVYENLIRGRFPYYTGYQYASTDFTEGLIFFPFTAIVGLMSFVFGPILSYNLLLLLSYAFVGLAGFYMVKQITKSPSAGIVAGVFLATVPFRTSFLYGQMVYGVDAVMLPLLIYSIERAKEKQQGRNFFAVGLIMFMTLTANFQMFYWGMLLLTPYFIYVCVGYLRSHDGSWLDKTKPIAWLIPGLIACCVYGLYIYSLMKGSSLKNGQDIAETLFYTPEFYRLFIKFNGNEKNVYLGLTTIFVVPWLLYPLLRARQAMARSPYIPLFFIIFAVGMFLVFGPYFDKSLRVSIYQWMFDHVPGFNGTRTPGRIMAVVVVVYAVLLGFATAHITEFLKTRLTKLFSWTFVIAVVTLVVYDFNYLKPGINIFEKENNAYRAIADKQKKVITLPFQLRSDHYFNSTFLTYALKYDLRLLVGHSSFYPKIVDAQVEKLFSINDGFIERDQWMWLNENDYEYIVVHATDFKPNVKSVVVGALNTSPYVDYVTSDNNVYLYKIRETNGIPKINENENINFNLWGEAIEAMSSKQSAGLKEIHYAYSWYSRELYENQKPFRWMKGVRSIIAIETSSEQKRKITFDYFCPGDDSLKINVHRADGEIIQEKLTNKWTRISINLVEKIDNVFFINLEAKSIFEAPPDTRKFGCQVSDVEVI